MPKFVRYREVDSNPGSSGNGYPGLESVQVWRCNGRRCAVPGSRTGIALSFRRLWPLSRYDAPAPFKLKGSLHRALQGLVSRPARTLLDFAQVVEDRGGHIVRMCVVFGF